MNAHDVATDYAITFGWDPVAVVVNDRDGKIEVDASDLALLLDCKDRLGE